MQFGIIGWQPGIPEVASIWDEDWDKFEDEGNRSAHFINFRYTMLFGGIYK